MYNWHDTMKPVIDEHAPIHRKTIKATKPCSWQTQKFIREMTKRDPLKCQKRDQLKRSRRSHEYKKKRNYVLNLAEKAEKIYFSQSVHDNRDMSSIWKATDSITGKNSKNSDTSASDIPHDILNDRSHSLSNRLPQYLKESSGLDSYICTSHLLDFFREE